MKFAKCLVGNALIGIRAGKQLNDNVFIIGQANRQGSKPREDNSGSG